MRSPSPFSSAQDFPAATEIERVSRVVSLTGCTCKSALAERMPHVALVFVTGPWDVPSTVQAMKSGAVDFLENPSTEQISWRLSREPRSEVTAQKRKQ
jgi:FixJ family two-component response regulator